MSKYLASIGAILVSLLIFVCRARPQETGPTVQPGTASPQFEVASIKLNPWTNEGRVGVFIVGDVLRAEHVDLYLLVEFAYGLPPDSYQLSGGPAWARRGVLSDVSGAESLLFQVTAKPAVGSHPSIEQYRLMLQALLADRFQLHLRRAIKTVPVFNLVVTRGGAKLKPSAPDARESLAMRDGRLFRMRATHVPLAQLVDELANPDHGAGRPVFDRTGLDGFYDFEIEWNRNDVAVPSDGQVNDVGGPSLFTALQQFGLKLEPGVAPLETIVIDHAEKPSGN